LPGNINVDSHWNVDSTAQSTHVLGDSS
jgi:hypothetical protein